MSTASDVAGSMGDVLGFLLSHQNLIGLMAQALEGGATSHDLALAIKKEMTAVSDKRMRDELGA